MKTTAPRRQSVGIKEIARQAKVSVATVSRVLNGEPVVSADLKRQVEDIVSRLGYRRNLVARNLRRQRTSSIGVIIPDIGNPHFSDAARALQDAAADAGYAILLMNSDGQEAREAAALQALSEHQVDGIILASAATTITPALRDFIDRDVPVVVMDRAIRNTAIDHVLVDTRAGTQDAVLHLASLGRRRIAFLAGPPRMWTAAEKLAGYRAGLREAGLPWQPKLVFGGDYSQQSGEAQAFAVLAQRPRPDALIIANNLMTLGAMRVLLRQQVAIPEDLALVGYDNTAWTDVVRPALTVVAQPTFELGWRAFGALLARLNDRAAKPVHIMISTKLIVRESTVPRAT